jgi:hypothetical protein
MMETNVLSSKEKERDYGPGYDQLVKYTDRLTKWVATRTATAAADVKKVLPVLPGGPSFCRG